MYDKQIRARCKTDPKCIETRTSTFQYIRSDSEVIVNASRAQERTRHAANLKQSIGPSRMFVREVYRLPGDPQAFDAYFDAIVRALHRLGNPSELAGSLRARPAVSVS